MRVANAVLSSEQEDDETYYRNLADEGWQSLTARELEVVQLAACGQSANQIADHLGVSVETSRTHLRRILSKLHLSSIVAVVIYAVQYKDVRCSVYDIYRFSER